MFHIDLEYHSKHLHWSIKSCTQKSSIIFLDCSAVEKYPQASSMFKLHFSDSHSSLVHCSSLNSHTLDTFETAKAGMHLERTLNCGPLCTQDLLPKGPDLMPTILIIMFVASLCRPYLHIHACNCKDLMQELVPKTCWPDNK